MTAPIDIHAAKALADEAFSVLSAERLCNGATIRYNGFNQGTVAADLCAFDVPDLIVELTAALREVLRLREELGGLQCDIADHVDDRLDWDRASDQSLYAIAEDIRQGAWRTWERK